VSGEAGRWTLIRTRYEDGGYSGGSIDRPALQQLLADIRARSIDVVVVYKVDRLTRSFADFAKLVELFDAHGVSFVSVTQQFNTTPSMGRLTLNVLLSFAQFEREVTGERIRDKIAASKRRSSWRRRPPISSIYRRCTVCVSGWSVSALHHQSDPRLPVGARRLPFGRDSVSYAPSCRASWPRRPMSCRHAWCASSRTWLTTGAGAAAFSSFLGGL
jgi:hypothetical protein